MRKNTDGDDDTISLTHAAANDGDWAELVPETANTLKAYLRTGQFLVLTTEEHPEALVLNGYPATL
jgi:hypothetical protein